MADWPNFGASIALVMHHSTVERVIIGNGREFGTPLCPGDGRFFNLLAIRHYLQHNDVPAACISRQMNR